MKEFCKNKREKGYTLAEVLATVAILLILMAIAVPAIFTIRKNLRQKALDSKAEIIYTAVQNNLVKMQSNGNSSMYAKDKANPMQNIPSDASDNKTYYYVTSATKDDVNSAANVLVTSDTVDDELYSHYWVVEYNPDSASVYAVFYSETRDNSDYVVDNYNDLRYKDVRLSDGARVGYYGGDAIDSSDTSTLAPKITITNEEKLIANITCMRQDSKDLSFEITLTDADNNSLTLKYKPSADKKSLVHDKDDLHLAATSKLDKNETSSIVGKKYTLNINLDDLTAEDGSLRFAALYGNKNAELTKTKTPLTAGTTLKIKATVRSASSRVDGKYSEAVTNSLFADTSSDTEADIIYGRHLQNLDQTSGVTEKITTAVQQSNIHFEEQDDKEEGDTSSWYSCYKAKTFTPITNNNLTSYKGSENVVIYHLTVDKAATISDTGRSGAGLFSVLKDGMKVDSVRLSGTSVKVTDGTNVSAGALAGETLGSATITNCQVYLENEDVEGKTDADAWISGADLQGGLLGSTTGDSSASVEITSSFAATVMDGGETGTVGGLIGQTSGKVTITKCYSDSYLTGQTTGGIIADGSTATISISSCYTAGYLKAQDNAGGMIAVGTATSIYFNHVYAAATFMEFSNDGEDDSSTDKKQAERYSIGPGTVQKGYYLNKGNIREDATHQDQGENVSYAKLSNRADMVAMLKPDGENSSDFVSATTTHAYNLRKQGLSSYSYPSLKNMPHYGDWQASYEPGSLVYYEKYEDDSVGFFGGNVTSTLSDDKTIVGDGYGVVYLERDKPTENVTVVCQTGADENTLTTITIKPDSSTYTVKVENNDYLIYPLSSEIMNADAISNTFYQKLVIRGAIATGNGTDGTQSQSDEVISGRTFYFNPHFAKTVVTTDEVPENPTRITLRTARQLYHLSRYYTDYAELVKSSTFMQEVDIDYTTYDWNNFAGIDKVTVQSPIGVKDGNITAFTSTYNGGSHEIRGISFESSVTEVGFVAENAGVIQNVFLVSDWSTGTDASNLYVNYTETIGSNRKVYMGGLTGINKGRIQNCAVCGYQLGKSGLVYVQRNGTLYMGGLTGSNQGSILNCEADTPSAKSNVLYGTAYLGGFAGENAASGTIRNCYALGNVAVTFARGANAVIGGFTANNTGVLRSDYCAVAMTAAGSTSTYGFAPKGNGIITSDCYYLNGGTFQYLGKMLAYDNDNQNGGGTGLSYDKMVEKTGTKPANSKFHGATSETDYPFGAVVTNSQGRVHYGNWQIPVNLGGMGVIYWELEEGGANNGYHFSYIGYTQDSADSTSTLHKVSGSTLCEQHDDGGKIRKYGYGYYYANTKVATEEPVMQEPTDFQTGDVNKEASAALTSRLDGFTVVAYTTEPAIEGTANSEVDGKYMKMTRNDRQANGQWSFNYKGQTYTFTINPFFANAMQYGVDDGTTRVYAIASQSLTVLDENGVAVQADTTDSMPGTSGNEYEIRSDDQLQYLNWNYRTKNAYTMIGESNYREQVSRYTYLGYASEFYQWTGNGSPTQQRYVEGRAYDRQNNLYYRSENTNYWAFVEDDNSPYTYTVTVWQEMGKDYWGTSYYSKSSKEKKGYWRWCGNSTTSINGQNYFKYINDSENVNYCWKQTHDVDAEMEHTSGPKFTQIGSMYDEWGKYDQEEAAAYMSYFSGSYDGNTYYIKNVEVDSKNTVVGLFGSIIGADVKNIILYSENNNYIQRNEGSPRSWYAIGGLCGIAAVGQGKNSNDVKIRNCTVSGYVIRDNSTQSSWGDGNVGGMFGMCTVNLTRCTAVNTIDLNCEFDNTKNDGVSVRVGGLVGSMRGKINSCYTGGEIKCEERCIKNAGEPAPEGGLKTKAKLFLGGITGGIYIKNKGNLTALMGGPILGLENVGYEACGDGAVCGTATTIISNCYTYIQMPVKTENSDPVSVIKSIEPIGSNGETPNENSKNHHVRVNVVNCYYYGNGITSLKQFTVQNAYNDKINWGNYTNIFSDAMAISWKQLAGKQTIEKNGKSYTLLEWLNNNSEGIEKNSNPEPFEKVTVSENNQKVNGKYSFPGDRADLNGEDYPFPTILQQSVGNGYVNVHYGEWPLEGIYWKESLASMDIYEDLVLEAGDNYGLALKDFDLLESTKVLGTDKQLGKGKYDFQVEYGSGDDNTATTSFTSDNNDSAEAVFSDGTDSVEEEFSSEVEFSDTTQDTTSADTGTSETTATDGTSRILDPKDYIAEVTALRYDNTKNCYVATVKALKTGSTVITVSTMVYTADAGDQRYSASFTLTVTADLTVYALPTEVKQNLEETADVTLYAVPTAMMTSTTDMSNFVGGNVIVGEEGFVGSGEETSSDVEAFAADSNYAEVTTDSDSVVEAYAGDLQNPEKNVASLITWDVKLGKEDEGALTISPVTNSQFKVKSEAEGTVTLTITGKFTYEDVEYSSITWLDVITTEKKEVKWQVSTGEITLDSSAAGMEKTFNLSVPNDVTPKIENFTITKASATDLQSYTDTDNMERTATDGFPVVTDVQKVSDTVYAVTIKGYSTGIFKITLNVTGTDETSYTASLILTVKDSTVSDENTGDASGTDSANEGWDEVPAEEDGDFTSDTTAGWGDQSDDYVDIVPDDDSTGFTGAGASWESEE